MSDDEAEGHLAHKQALVLDRDGNAVFPVDEGIQSLVQYLFDKGIQTFNSCEANFDEYIWVEYKLEDWMGITSRAFQGNTYVLMQFIVNEKPAGAPLANPLGLAIIRPTHTFGEHIELYPYAHRGSNSGLPDRERGDHT